MMASHSWPRTMFSCSDSRERYRQEGTTTHRMRDRSPFFAYRSSCVGMYMPHILGQPGGIVKHCPGPEPGPHYTGGITYVVF